MKIAVVDGQGGGLGKVIIERLKKEFAGKVKIIALGTNGVATTVMLKAGADEGASGENAMAHNLENVDIITGSFSVVIPNSMMGEITSRMVNAIIKSPAVKYLLPLKNKHICLMGIKEQPLPKFIEELTVSVNKNLKDYQENALKAK